MTTPKLSTFRLERSTLGARARLCLAAAGALLVACKPTASTPPVGGEPPPPPIESHAAVWPDEAFRAAAPAPGEPRPAPAPTLERFTLGNGAEVFALRRPELPVLEVVIEFDRGEVDDPKGKSGAHGLCFDLLDEGTRALDKVAFATKLDDHAANLSASAGAERSTISLRVLEREAGHALDLLREMLTQPGLRETDLERLRARAKASLMQTKAAPAGIAGRLFPTLVFGATHAWGRLTTESSLGAIGLPDCRKLAASLGARGGRVYVISSMEPTALRELLDAHLTGWTGKAPPRRASKAPTKTASRIVLAAQSQVWVGRLGPRRDAPGYESVLLMDQILGGGFTSRINMNLREDKGWSYGGGGGHRYRAGGSMLVLSSSIEKPHTVSAVSEIAKEVVRMRGEAAGPDELSREREGLVLSLPARFADAASAMGTYRELAFYGLPVDWYAGYADRLRTVDAQSVLSAAARELDEASGWVVLVVGDAASSRAGLQALAKSGVLGITRFEELDADGLPAKARPAQTPASPEPTSTPAAAGKATDAPAKPAPEKGGGGR
jgi:predicted Zn-dependent peptidase